MKAALYQIFSGLSGGREAAGHSCGFYPPLSAHQTRLSCWFWLSLIDPLPLQLRPYYPNATADDREFKTPRHFLSYPITALLCPLPPGPHWQSCPSALMCPKKIKKARNALWKPLNQPNSPICGKCISGAQLVPILSQRAGRSIGELWHFAHIDSRAPLKKKKKNSAYFPYLFT